MGAYVVACHDERNIASGQHTATDGYMKTGSSSSPPVSYDEAIAQLDNPPDPNDAERYRAMKVSLVRDSNGDYVLKKVATEDWAPGTWLHVWVPNLDPELNDAVLGEGLAQWLRQNLIEPAFANTSSIGAVLDAVMLDNFMSAPVLDMDTSHFRYADLTLSYDPNTFMPGIHTMSATREYLSWMRSYLDASYPDTSPGLSCNTKGVGTITVTGSIEANGTDLIRLMAPGCRSMLLKSASVTFKAEAGRDRARVRGSFDDPGSTPDFLGSDVTFRLADRDGEAWQAVVPAGSFTSSNGKRFKFRDKTGTVANGLTRATFWQRRDGSWKWNARVKDTDLHALDRLHLDVFLEVGTGSCWADMRDCTSKRKGKTLRCRA